MKGQSADWRIETLEWILKVDVVVEVGRLSLFRCMQPLYRFLFSMIQYHARFSDNRICDLESFGEVNYVLE